MHCCLALRSTLELHCVVFSALFSVALRGVVALALHCGVFSALFFSVVLRGVIFFFFLYCVALYSQRCLGLRCVLALRCIVFSALFSVALRGVVFLALRCILSVVV